MMDDSDCMICSRYAPTLPSVMLRSRCLLFTSLFTMSWRPVIFLPYAVSEGEQGEDDVYLADCLIYSSEDGVPLNWL